MVVRGLVLRVLSVIAAGTLLSACAERLPRTDLMVDNVVVGAMAAMPTGGFIYGERLTGDVHLVVDTDARDDSPTDAKKIGTSRVEDFGHVDVSKGGQRGLLGLLQDGDKTYAAWTDTSDQLVVGELLRNPSSARVIWRGPKAAETNIGGRLAMSPLDRLVVSVGDLQQPDKVNDPNSLNGKLLSLDPARNEEQRPNIISQGWTNPQGIVYDRGGNLWVTDGDRLARAGDKGTLGDVTELGENVGASGIALFSDKELLVCQRANQQLERYLFVDGVRAVPGRTVAKNCAYDVIQQKNGTITYATDTTIRVASN